MAAAAGTKRARVDDVELFWAARFGRVGQLRELLQRGAAFDWVDPSHGHTALAAAAQSVKPHAHSPLGNTKSTLEADATAPARVSPCVRIRQRPRPCSSTLALTST